MAGQLRVDEITDEAGTGSPSFPVGNVGIGTSSPTARVHASTGASSALSDVRSMVRAEGTSEAYLSAAANAFAGVRFPNASSASQGKIDYAHSTNSMEFGTNNAERMRIDSSGNLLVGQTSSNGGRLEITPLTGTRFASSIQGSQRVFHGTIQKSLSTTHTCAITFLSQTSNHLSHIVEVSFAASTDNVGGGSGGKAAYVLRSFNSLASVTEIQNIGAGTSFAASVSGMVLTITATTTTSRNTGVWTVTVSSTTSFGAPTSISIA